MNTKENEVAAFVLDEIKDKLRTDQSQAAKTLAEAYHELCQAFCARVEAERGEK